MGASRRLSERCASDAGEHAQAVVALKCLSQMAPRSDAIEDLRDKLNELLSLLARWDQAVDVDEAQLDLFENGFCVVQKYYELKFDISKALVRLLLPNRLLGEAMISAFTPRSLINASVVTRLVDRRPEPLRWSLFTAFGRERHMRRALKHLAQHGIYNVCDLVARTELNAFIFARTDPGTWIRLSERLSSLGLAFAMPNEQTYSFKAIQ